MRYVTRTLLRVNTLSRRVLSPLRERRLLAPVAWMLFAPLLHTPGIFRIAKIIPVARFAQPTRLTGRFAGPATIRLGTIFLMAGVSIIGLKELITTTALASSGLGTHNEGNRQEENAKANPECCRAAQKRRKKEEEL